MPQFVHVCVDFINYIDERYMILNKVSVNIKRVCILHKRTLCKLAISTWIYVWKTLRQVRMKLIKGPNSRGNVI